MSKPEFVAPRTLWGVADVGPSSFAAPEGSGAQFASELWMRLIQQLNEAGVSTETVMYGVSLPADDSTPPQQVEYFCGLESAQGIQGLSRLELEGGAYFEFRYEGPAAEIDKGFQDAYGVALDQSGLIPREGQHLEIYGLDYDPTSPISKFRILIPVQP